MLPGAEFYLERLFGGIPGNKGGGGGDSGGSGFGSSGDGINSNNLNGYYYDWYSSTYRTTGGSFVPYGEVYNNVIQSNIVARLEGADANEFADYLNAGFEMRYMSSGNNAGYVAFKDGHGGASVIHWTLGANAGGGWSDVASHFNDGIGGFGSGFGKLSGTFRLTDGAYNGSNLSLRYYSSGWSGGSRAEITTYSAAKLSSKIVRGSIVVSVGLGFYGIYSGVQQDGGTYGLNAQVATGQMVGGIGGASAGAEIGAGIGVWFGGVGAIPGAIIGGIIGGWIGSEAGKEAVFAIRN